MSRRLKSFWPFLVYCLVGLFNNLDSRYWSEGSCRYSCRSSVSLDFYPYPIALSHSLIWKAAAPFNIMAFLFGLLVRNKLSAMTYKLIDLVRGFSSGLVCLVSVCLIDSRSPRLGIFGISYLGWLWFCVLQVSARMLICCWECGMFAIMWCTWK